MRDIAGICSFSPACIRLDGAEKIAVEREGRSHTLLFDGELYNTDSRSLLAGLMEEGERFLEKCNGVFAFAYWDGRTLLLARDRLGVKPLYYALEDGRLYFASTLKTLFTLGVQPKIDQNSLREIFALGPAHTPGSGVFSGVKEVLPAQCLRFDGDGLHASTYWRLRSLPHTDGHDETVGKVAELVRDSVECQTNADAPVCALLSGGLDSSLVSAISAKKLAAQGKQLTTFSFDFAGNDAYFRENANAFQPSRDAPFAREMAEYLHAEHIELTCGSAALADLLEPAMLARDLPGMADVDASLLYFCGLVGNEYKVALTGEVADEVFMGYPWFRSEAVFARREFPWSDMDARRTFLRDDVLDELDLEAYAQAAYETAAAETPYFDDDDKASPLESFETAERRKIAWLNLCWFGQTLLDRMDRCARAASLTARVPFADYRLLEYVWNIPWALQNKDGCVKYVLRMAGRGWLPDAVLWRRKSPFPKTYNPEYTQIIAQRMRDLLASPNEPIHALIDKKKAEAFLREAEYNKPWYGQLMAGPQRIAYFLQVNAWLKRYG